MRIVFTKTVNAGFGKGRDNITLYREFDLPFAPHTGMSIVDGNWRAQAIHVEYDARKRTFICRDEGDHERRILSLQGFKPPPIEEIVAKYIKKGWTDRVLV